METKNKFFCSFINNVLLAGKTTDKIYESTNFDLWFCSKNLSFDNNKELRLKDISNIFYNSNNNKGDSFNITRISAIYLNNLGQLDIDSVYHEDNLPSSGSYQEMLDIPASAYMFTNYNTSNDYIIKKDGNYKGFNYYVDDTFNDINGSTNILSRKNSFDITTLIDTAITNYWNLYCKDYFENEYAFSNKFNIDEYNTYNIRRTNLIEDKTNVHSIDKDFDIMPTSYVGGALLITWYDGTRRELYNYEGKLYYKTTLQKKLNMEGSTKDITYMDPVYKLFPVDYNNGIPVCYIELPKTYSLKDNKINIQWSENGIFSLK